MERNINKKVESYNKEYKEFIKQQFIDLDTFILDNVHSNTTEYNKIHTILMNNFQKCYDYKKLVLYKEDFQKRKRVKNAVSLCERCCACRANKEQCTRRKKDGSEFCGTHVKGTPHGVIKDISNIPSANKKTTVWAQDIKGIMYYIDDNSNVYSTEDVMKNVNSPRVIANYKVEEANGESVFTLINYS